VGQLDGFNLYRGYKVPTEGFDGAHLEPHGGARHRVASLVHARGVAAATRFLRTRELERENLEPGYYHVLRCKR
jgi:hypothetical protein